MDKSIKQRYDEIEAALIKKHGGVGLVHVGSHSPEAAKKHQAAMAKNKETAANREAFIKKCHELGLAESQAFDASFFHAEAVNKNPVMAAINYVKAFNQ